MKGDDSAVIRMMDFFNAFGNKNRREIMKICYKNPLSISELARQLKSSNKVTWQNVKILEKVGFVVLVEREKEKHHPVYVVSKVKPEWYNNLFAAMEKDITEMLKDVALINDLKEKGFVFENKKKSS